MIDQAFSLASSIHSGQRDKSGEAYILHVVSVMELARKSYTEEFMREEILVTALLHDVIEDNRTWSDGMLEDYIKETFGQRVLEAILSMSHKKGENYEDYIDRVSCDWISTIVKIADLTHNMDPSRLPSGEITQVDFDRWDKYRKALVKLKGGMK